MHEELETTIVEFDEETGVGTITMNRPDALNALSSQLRADIVAGLELLEEQNEAAGELVLRAVVLEGSEGNFCAGADINEFSDASPGGSSERSHYEVIRDFPAPVIAKIEGYCLGGGLETALSCDVRIAHEEARLGLPEVNLGIIPGAGGVQMISSLAGPAAAMEVAMTGDHLPADEAEDLGIVNRVYGDDFDDDVTEFAEEIASKPPLAIQAIKKSARMATQAGLTEGITYDQQQFGELLQTEDHAEGARGFAEDDYEPEFKGR
ncbi:enoyl-CoA hydratase/isomerase family protein [Natrarchaeobaculum aegyptiacum]|uniref:Enoyl-CoA hydratase n=1 Tax=Natrarchaeobaculum aegyptiacum TaxID=745377 RepID=A0A2Z2HVF5_9EURY|nr:enoyl-CoA hydratase/isomerase family protein [Natrarchaeobaculum aegyptiacum]ARS91180.1 enoyl-CoA hydratase [Natrarchaeobaculum aegyptiacum]